VSKRTRKKVYVTPSISTNIECQHAPDARTHELVVHDYFHVKNNYDATSDLYRVIDCYVDENDVKHMYEQTASHVFARRCIIAFGKLFETGLVEMFNRRLCDYAIVPHNPVAFASVTKTLTNTPAHRATVRAAILKAKNTQRFEYKAQVCTECFSCHVLFDKNHKCRKNIETAVRQQRAAR
jgi:hypothetical protein